MYQIYSTESSLNLNWRASQCSRYCIFTISKSWPFAPLLCTLFSDHTFSGKSTAETIPEPFWKVWARWERRILQWGTELYRGSFTIHFLINSPFHKTVLNNVSVKQSCESTENPGSSKGILQAAAHAQAPKTACKTIIISSKPLKYLQVSNCSHHHFLLARFCWQNSCLSVMYQTGYRIGKKPTFVLNYFLMPFFFKFKCFTLSPPHPQFFFFNLR